MTVRNRLSRVLRRWVVSPRLRSVLKPLHRNRHLLGAGLEAQLLRLANPRNKRFIPPHLEPVEFFRALERHHVDYVVLRWFEHLPRIEPGHDLDLLVSDESVAAVDAQLTAWPIGCPVDLYSVSGIGGTGIGQRSKSYGSVPVFPHAAAREILTRRVRFRDLAFVPAAEDHFLSLVYHAAYAKMSGLPFPGEATNCRPSDRNYGAAIAHLARQAGIDLPGPITRETLDSILAPLGWRPNACQAKAFGAASAWFNPAAGSIESRNSSTDTPPATRLPARRRNSISGRSPRGLEMPRGEVGA